MPSNATQKEKISFTSRFKSFLSEHKSGTRLFKPVFIVLGLISLIWFLIRVIPKPSRAAYPCLQTAFPIASAFVIWLTGSLGAITLLRKVPIAFKNKNYLRLGFFSLAGISLFAIAVTIGSNQNGLAGILSSQEEIAPVKKEYGNTIDQLKAKVAVVKSDKELVTEIQYPEILSMVREAVNMAGGLQHLISDGKTVMLKPNLVNDYANRTIQVNGATTDYRVVQAVVELVRELNPSGKIILAEGSGGATPTMDIMARLKYLTIPGIDYFMSFDAFSGNYRDFASDSITSVELPDSLSFYPDEKKPNNSRKIYFNKRYFEADVLISIPVLKNHARAGITGGVKNVAIGATPANLYADKNNASPFLRSPIIDHNDGYLAKWMHDYYVARPVDFVIIDGLQGGSSGPGVGGNNLTAIKRNQHNMRLIMAGRDAVATDAIAGLIIGHDPQRSNHLIYVHNSGFGIVDPALIEVVGVKVHTVRKFFGFDNTYQTQTAFTKAAATNYYASCSIVNNTLHLSVSNPEDLARMTIRVDNQKLDKYVVRGFNDVSLSLENITVTQGLVDVYFEDKYLNPLSKQFMATILSSRNMNALEDNLSLYPNPARDFLNIRLKNAPAGNYRISITDMNGKEVVSAENSNSSGIYEDYILTEKLKSGYYLLKMALPDGKEVLGRFLKQ